MELNRAEPTSELYLRSEGRGGGPTDPIIGFQDNINKMILVIYLFKLIYL